MADYIERGDAFDAIMGQFCACSDETEAALNGAIEDIRKIPAADARPVVLCCNCKHYNQFGCNIGCGWCEATGIRTYDDFFCAGGRWKSNGADMRGVQDGV